MQCENMSTPIYVECDRMYRSKVCIQEFWYIVSGLDIQPGTVRKRFLVATYDESYTIFSKRSIQTHGSVVQALSSESGDLEKLTGC